MGICFHSETGKITQKIFADTPNNPKVVVARTLAMTVCLIISGITGILFRV